MVLRRSAPNGFFPPDAQEGRFCAPGPPHPRVLPVETALRECAGISAREFALFVVDEQGTEKTYSSSSIVPFQQRLFSDQFRADFHRYSRRHSDATPYGFEARSGDFDVDNAFRQNSFGVVDDRRRLSRQTRSEDSDDDSPRLRKRSRPALYGQYTEPDSPSTVQSQKYQQLVIGEEAEVEKFYSQRFRDMQQSSCKVMGKAFVKLVEPKKQTHFPYTKGEAQAPSWWPLDGGQSKKVRHREPDHLLKPERIRLLVHVLRMVVQPHAKQHPSVQKLGLNVQRLHEATLEVMTPWFNDKEHLDNAHKVAYFKEIFKVAKAEERYLNGEIDATTRIPVMSGDNRTALEASDDDEGDDDDEEQTPTLAAVVSTPDSTMVSPSMIHSSQSEPEQSFPSRIIPVRYPPQMESHQTSFANFQPTSPSSQDPNRRGFPSPGFHSPQQNMYGWGQPSTLVGSGSHATYYVQASQQPTVFQLPLPTSISQPMLPPPINPHHYDLSNSSRFDTNLNLGPQVRTSSLGHPQHHGLTDYYHDNSGYGHNDAEHQG